MVKSMSVAVKCSHFNPYSWGLARLLSFDKSDYVFWSAGVHLSALREKAIPIFCCVLCGIAVITKTLMIEFDTFLALRLKLLFFFNMRSDIYQSPSLADCLVHQRIRVQIPRYWRKVVSMSRCRNARILSLSLSTH